MVEYNYTQNAEQETRMKRLLAGSNNLNHLGHRRLHTTLEFIQPIGGMNVGDKARLHFSAKGLLLLDIIQEAYFARQYFHVTEEQALKLANGEIEFQQKLFPLVPDGVHVFKEAATA